MSSLKKFTYFADRTPQVRQAQSQGRDVSLALCASKAVHLYYSVYVEGPAGCLICSSLSVARCRALVFDKDEADGPRRSTFLK